MESEYAAESRIWQKFALHKWQWYDLQLASGEAWDNEKIQIFNHVLDSKKNTQAVLKNLKESKIEVIKNNKRSSSSFGQRGPFSCYHGSMDTHAPKFTYSYFMRLFTTGSTELVSEHSQNIQQKLLPSKEVDWPKKKPGKHIILISYPMTKSGAGNTTDHVPWLYMCNRKVSDGVYRRTLVAARQFSKGDELTMFDGFIEHPDFCLHHGIKKYNTVTNSGVKVVNESRGANGISRWFALNGDGFEPWQRPMYMYDTKEEIGKVPQSPFSQHNPGMKRGRRVDINVSYPKILNFNKTEDQKVIFGHERVFEGKTHQQLWFALPKDVTTVQQLQEKHPSFFDSRAGEAATNMIWKDYYVDDEQLRLLPKVDFSRLGEGDSLNKCCLQEPPYSRTSGVFMFEINAGAYKLDHGHSFWPTYEGGSWPWQWAQFIIKTPTESSPNTLLRRDMAIVANRLIETGDELTLEEGYVNFIPNQVMQQLRSNGKTTMRWSFWGENGGELGRWKKKVGNKFRNKNNPNLRAYFQGMRVNSTPVHELQKKGRNNPKLNLNGHHFYNPYQENNAALGAPCNPTLIEMKRIVVETIQRAIIDREHQCGWRIHPNKQHGALSSHHKLYFVNWNDWSSVWSALIVPFTPKSFCMYNNSDVGDTYTMTDTSISGGLKEAQTYQTRWEKLIEGEDIEVQEGDRVEITDTKFPAQIFANCNVERLYNGRTLDVPQDGIKYKNPSAKIYSADYESVIEYVPITEHGVNRWLTKNLAKFQEQSDSVQIIHIVCSAGDDVDDETRRKFIPNVSYVMGKIENSLHKKKSSQMLHLCNRFETNSILNDTNLLKTSWYGFWCKQQLDTYESWLPYNPHIEVSTTTEGQLEKIMLVFCQKNSMHIVKDKECVKLLNSRWYIAMRGRGSVPTTKIDWFPGSAKRRRRLDVKTKEALDSLVDGDGGVLPLGL